MPSPTVGTAPAIVEVYSRTSRMWHVALVVAEDGDIITVRFPDATGAALEKSTCRSDPQLAPFGSHNGWAAPPGWKEVPSASKPGTYTYLDPLTCTKYRTPALAWQAYLEQQCFADGKPAPCQAPPPAPAGSDSWSREHGRPVPQQQQQQQMEWLMQQQALAQRQHEQQPMQQQQQAQHHQQMGPQQHQQMEHPPRSASQQQPHHVEQRHPLQNEQLQQLHIRLEQLQREQQEQDQQLQAEHHPAAQPTPMMPAPMPQDLPQGAIASGDITVPGPGLLVTEPRVPAPVMGNRHHPAAVGVGGSDQERDTLSSAETIADTGCGVVRAPEAVQPAPRQAGAPSAPTGSVPPVIPKQQPQGPPERMPLATLARLSPAAPPDAAAGPTATPAAVAPPAAGGSSMPTGYGSPGRPIAPVQASSGEEQQVKPPDAKFFRERPGDWRSKAGPDGQVWWYRADQYGGEGDAEKTDAAGPISAAPTAATVTAAPCPSLPNRGAPVQRAPLATGAPSQPAAGFQQHAGVAASTPGVPAAAGFQQQPGVAASTPGIPPGWTMRKGEAAAPSVGCETALLCPLQTQPHASAGSSEQARSGAAPLPTQGGSAVPAAAAVAPVASAKAAGTSLGSSMASQPADANMAMPEGVPHYRMDLCDTVHATPAATPCDVTLPPGCRYQTLPNVRTF